MSYRRNLVIVLAHGLRSDAVGDSHTWPLTTPSMEALAARGMRLVATSACPSDPGGMVSLLTGLHARQHGLLRQGPEIDGIRGWPAAMHDEGYYTVGVGAVGGIRHHLDHAVHVHGVESKEFRSCSYLSATRTKGLTAALLQQRRQRARQGPFEPDRLLIDPADDIDGYIADQAECLLSSMPVDRSWALIVSFTGPGNDLPPPPLYSDVVNPKLLEDGFVPTDFRSIDAVAELDYPRSQLQRLDAQRLGRIRADYLGRVSLIDYAIGRFAKLIDSRDDRSRTWSIVAGDHGYLLGEQGLIGHRSFLAPALETPVIITPPTPAPRQDMSSTLVSTVDVAATISDLAACDPAPHCIGRSLLCLLRDQPFTSATGGACLSECGDRVMLETERHRVIFDIHSLWPVALFDLLNDGEERENLVETPAGSNLIDSLRWRMADALMPLRSGPM